MIKENEWAVVDANGIVTNVIVADDDFVAAHPEMKLVKTNYDPVANTGKVGVGFKFDGLNFFDQKPAAALDSWKIAPDATPAKE